MVTKEAGGGVLAQPGGQETTGVYLTEWGGKAMEGLGIGSSQSLTHMLGFIALRT